MLKLHKRIDDLEVSMTASMDRRSRSFRKSPPPRPAATYKTRTQFQGLDSELKQIYNPFHESDLESEKSDNPIYGSDLESKRSYNPFQRSDSESKKSYNPFKRSDSDSKKSHNPLKKSDTELKQSYNPFQQSNVESKKRYDPCGAQSGFESDLRAPHRLERRFGSEDHLSEEPIFRRRGFSGLSLSLASTKTLKPFERTSSLEDQSWENLLACHPGFARLDFSRSGSGTNKISKSFQVPKTISKRDVLDKMKADRQFETTSKDS